MEHVCKNCGTAFEDKFCNHCGQKFDVPRFTFKHIVEEGFHAFTHADKSFLTYLSRLLTNPGKLAYEYIVERKRKKYFSPFTFFVLITAIDAVTTGWLLNLNEHLFHQNNEYGRLFNVSSKILAFAVIPTVALIMWLIHSRKSRLLFSEYTVFAMIIWSLYSAIGVLVTAMQYVLIASTHRDFNITNNYVFLALLLAIFTYADYAFHRRLRGAWWKSLLVAVGIAACIFGSEVFLIWGYFNGFEGIGRFNSWGIYISYGYKGA